MTSHPLPDLDEFAADARRWLSSVAEPRSTAQWGEGPDSVAVFENWTAEQERAETDRIRGYEQAKYDAGLGRAHLARGVRRPQPPDVVRAGVPAGGGGVRRPASHRDVLGHPAARRSHRRPVGHRRAAGALRAGDAAHRPDRLPAVLRDRGGLRPGRGPHPGRRALDERTGSSTATRCGPPARRSPTSASRSPAPTRPRPSTPGSPSSWCRWTPRASPCGRSAR